MPVTIHLVRHAQGLHNISRENESIHDPILTEEGQRQCAVLSKEFPYHDKVVRCFASPLIRALQTCILSFKQETRHAADPVIAIPSFQEASDLPCDTGSASEVIRRKFGKAVDVSRLGEGWNTPEATTSWQQKEDLLTARAKRARADLFDAIKDLVGDSHVVLVSHGAFLHFVTDDYSGIELGHGKYGRLLHREWTRFARKLKHDADLCAATSWTNTEYRTYYLSGTDDSNTGLRLEETQGSWERRNGSTARPSDAEQSQMRADYMSTLRSFYELERDP